MLGPGRISKFAHLPKFFNDIPGLSDAKKTAPSTPVKSRTLDTLTTAKPPQPSPSKSPVHESTKKRSRPEDSLDVSQLHALKVPKRSSENEEYANNHLDLQRIIQDRDDLKEKIDKHDASLRELDRIEEELADKKEMLASANALIDESMQQLAELEKTEASLLDKITVLERRIVGYEKTVTEMEVFRTKVADSLGLVKKDTF